MTEEKVGSVNDVKQVHDKEGGGVNLGRHQAQCTICSSPYREQIEQEWIRWHSPDHFEKLFDVSRDALYRHAHAFDLFSKRRQNVSMALDKIIERVDWTATSGSVVLAAIKALAKINSKGQGVEHIQSTDPTKLFKRMSPEERAAFAKDGSLPDWFSRKTGAAPGESQEGEQESQVPEPQRLQ